jgi:co-chaperonin GroES (HSP10)
MKIRPIHTNLLVRPVSQDTESGGFVLPESQQNQTCKAEIVSVGFRADEDFKVGQTVVYARFSGHEIGDLLLIEQTDILGILED